MAKINKTPQPTIRPNGNFKLSNQTREQPSTGGASRPPRPPKLTPKTGR